MKYIIILLLTFLLCLSNALGEDKPRYDFLSFDCEKITIFWAQESDNSGDGISGKILFSTDKDGMLITSIEGVLTPDSIGYFFGDPVTMSEEAKMVPTTHLDLIAWQGALDLLRSDKPHHLSNGLTGTTTTIIFDFYAADSKHSEKYLITGMANFVMDYLNTKKSYVERVKE